MANYKSESLNADPKDKKRKIQPEETHKKLLKDNRGDCIFVVALFIIVNIFIVPISILGINVGMIVVSVILICVSFGLFTVWFIYCYRRYLKVAKGKYSLKLDTVERVVTDDRYVRRGRASYYEHAIYLWHCGRVVVSLEETYLYSEGDSCYVFIIDENETPLAVYNTKFYELDDIEEPTEE